MSLVTESHQQQRQQLYNKVDNFWHDLHETEYALYDILLLPKSEIEAIRKVANRLSTIFFKTANLLRGMDDQTLASLGLPEGLIPYVRLNTIDIESVISRLDLVKTHDGYKCLEINSDTPTFIKELFHVNKVVSQNFNVDDPNTDESGRLSESLRHVVNYSHLMNGYDYKPNVVFTSHGDDEEDKNTTLYLMELSGLDAKYVPLDSLEIIKGEGLFDDTGERVDVLYRQTYPLEHLINDEDPISGDKVGELLLDLVKNKKLALLNPPSAFLLQSKSVQAVIWALHNDESDYFTKQEHEWIRSHMLPTYLDNEPFWKANEKYVKKPSFGREGDTVEIYDPNGKMVMEDPNKTYKEELPIYQKYVDLPTTAVKTVSGKKDLHYMIGCFLLEGKASAIGVRAGNQITDNESYYLPLGVKN